MADRKKVLFISDHPLIPSGVGCQAKSLIEGLLETGKYKFLCFGGAIKHPSYNVQHVAPDKFGEGNWLILPVDGHGDPDKLRNVLQFERPDAVIIFTDPRFFYWVWEMEDEIRSICPLLYWHVWDNDPLPDYNRVFYDSTDFVAALSLKTYGILQGLGVDKSKFSYIPHGLSAELFKPLPEEDIQAFKKAHLGPHADKKFLVMWNNRNARRKQTGDVIESVAMLAKDVGKENVSLFMHTMVNDPEGQDILAVSEKLGIQDCLVISEQRVDPPMLNSFYNAADVTINIASNEGFGLATLESMFAGTPIVASFTGGLQYQLGDWYGPVKDFSDQAKLTEGAKKRWLNKQCDWWGVPVFPVVRSCVGSQQTPYIYDDRVSNVDVYKALRKMYDLGRVGRKAIGLKAREWVVKHFNIDDVVSKWDSTIEGQIACFTAQPQNKHRVVNL
jgi:glycosyltransferase involved in cell wall biosynthesis